MPGLAPCWLASDCDRRGAGRAWPKPEQSALPATSSTGPASACCTICPDAVGIGNPGLSVRVGCSVSSARRGAAIEAPLASLNYLALCLWARRKGLEVDYSVALLINRTGLQRPTHCFWWWSVRNPWVRGRPCVYQQIL